MPATDPFELPEPCMRLLLALALRELKKEELDSAAQCDAGKGQFYADLLIDEGLAEGGTMIAGYVYGATAKGRKLLLRRGLIS